VLALYMNWRCSIIYCVAQVAHITR
jgi:hypothetical protein